MNDQIDSVSTMTKINERLQYSGTGTELAILMFKNLALTILTLGIYWAWGRTNTRRYLWGKVSFLGDRVAYTGTGKELFRGWVMLFVFYIVAFIVVTVLAKIIGGFVSLLMFPVYIYLFSLVIYSGTKYRLARTVWRETRFGLFKNKELTRQFAMLNAKGIVLSVVTLGIYSPYYQNQRRKFIIDKASFGTAKFNFEGDDSEYFWLCIKGFFLTAITLGIYFPWMKLSLVKYEMRNTNVENSVKFDIHLKGSDILVFSVIAYLATVFTFGLALPWVINATYKLFVNAVEINGEIDFSKIQNPEVSESSAYGDVAAIEYDIDLGF